MKRALTALFLTCALLAPWREGSAAADTTEIESPSPYALLGVRIEHPSIDAVAACIGDAPRAALADSSPGEASAARPAVHDDDEASAARPAVHDDDESVTPLTTPEIRLAAAILSAREATEPDEQKLARRRLVETLAKPASPRTMACGWLELARLELRSGRHPEARVSAARALRVFPPEQAPDGLVRTVDFHRAESQARNGEWESARAIYAELSTGDDSIARAARIRLADDERTRTPSTASRLRLETLLTGDAELDIGPWGPKLAEWAIEEKDLEAARRWLDRSEPDRSAESDVWTAAAAIRRADILHAEGDTLAARKILRELVETGRSKAIQRLAQMRRIDHSGSHDRLSLDHLERSFRMDAGPIAAYSGDLLAHRLHDDGQDRLALEVLVEFIHRMGSATQTRFDRALLDDILSRLSSEGDCDTWIEQVSGRRDLLLRHASSAEPFLVLGDCYRATGLSMAALDTYRGIAKSFGPTVVAALTLRSAEVEYDLGRIAAAGAAARANVLVGNEPNDGWRLLLARVRWAEGESARSLQILRPLVERIGERRARESRTRDAEVILLAARAASASETDGETLEHLRRALTRISATAESDRRVVEASLIIGDMYRRAGELELARDFYAPAVEGLEPGVLRSRASYWLGVLTSPPDAARAFWMRVAADDDPWARLAANELALADGRAAVGEPLSVPMPRRPQSITGASR